MGTGRFRSLRSRALVGAAAAFTIGAAAFAAGAGDALASHVAYIHHSAASVAAVTAPGKVPGPYLLGSYISGGDASGTAPANSWTFTTDAVFDPLSANALDHHWMQASTSPLIFDMGAPTSTAIVFPSIDHGPMSPVPYEALESTVWGSNNPAAPFPAGWQLATLTRVYADGWVDVGAAQESDDYASVWAFPAGSFRYVAVYANRSVDFTPDNSDTNDCSGEGVWCSSENEIDAVGRVLGADLTITKAPKPGQPAPVPGGLYSFIIRVRNDGTAATLATRDVMVRDDLSAMGTFVFWTANSGICSNNAPYVDCSRRALAPGEEWWIEIRVRLPGNVCTALDRARVDWWGLIPETNELNNTATLSVPVPGPLCDQ